MGAPSSEQEARDRRGETERMPRAQDISDRIQKALDALPFPALDAAMSKRRDRLENFQVAMSMTLAWGRDIGEREHSEWLTLLDEESTGADA